VNIFLPLLQILFWTYELFARQNNYLLHCTQKKVVSPCKQFILNGRNISWTTDIVELCEHFTSSITNLLLNSLTFLWTKKLYIAKYEKNIVYNVNNLFWIVRIYFELVIFWNFVNIFFLFYKFCCELVNIFSGPKNYLLHSTWTIILHQNNLFWIVYFVFFKNLFCIL
jgi:hypothetical protein